MRIPIRNTTTILGIVLLGCAGIALIKSTISSPNGASRESLATPGSVTNPDETPGQSGAEAATSMEGEQIGRTKSKQRPVETATDKKRRQRDRLVDTLERYKAAGLGERYPDVVKTTEELKKIEAELAEPTKPTD